MVTATFLTEDSYLGEITNPLTLNRYNYTLSNYLNYQDPSGHWITTKEINQLKAWYHTKGRSCIEAGKCPSISEIRRFLSALHELGSSNATIDFVTNFNYQHNENYFRKIMEIAERKCKNHECEIFKVSLEQLKEYGWRDFGENEEQYIIYFNKILNKYGITDDNSIIMFMATMAHETSYGLNPIEGMVNGKETLTENNWAGYRAKAYGNQTIQFSERGTGYLQLT